MAKKRRWAWAPLALLALLAALDDIDVVEGRAVDHVHDLSSEIYSEIRELLSMHRAQHQQRGDPTCSLASSLKFLGEVERGGGGLGGGLVGGAQREPYPPGRPRLVPNWPLHGPPPLGQVAGVAVALNGFPVVFHRGARVFDEKSFNATHHFQFVDEGPIPEDTVLTLDPDNGDVLAGWGRDLFYMPHSITIDNRGNTWVTDVALHQVLKFKPGEKEPSLTLGQRLRPGDAKHQLCMPTDVAVASTGEVFVSDGYCNSRVLQFDEKGVYGGRWPEHGSADDNFAFRVPHAVAYLERIDRLCVADRENQRVVCTPAALHAAGGKAGRATTVVQTKELGRPFALAVHGDFVYAVNGYSGPTVRVGGYTLDPEGESIVDSWGPPQGMTNPHAIAVSPDGSALYVSEIGPNRVWKFDLPSRG